MTTRLIAFSLLLCLAAGLAADVAVPPLKARVTDLTATLKRDEIQTLDASLAALEAKKGSQVAILIVPTTEPETIEQYSIRVAEKWKLGRKGVDDGVLLLVAKNDRTVRIEVGYGLEGALPDAIARRIIDEYIVPRFRVGDFPGGIGAGVDRIARVIRGEPLPQPVYRQVDTSTRIEDWVIPIMFFLFVSGGLFRAAFGRLLGSLMVGGIVGAVMNATGLGLAGAIMFGLFAFVVMLITPKGGGRGGGFSSSGGFSSGGGFSSSGGGFSGGGGSFGGGGASGRW